MGWVRIKRFYHEKTKLEKLLLICVSLLVFVVVVLFVCLLTAHDNEICSSPECIRSSVHLLDTVNLNVDPCDDFYAFACGNFIKNAFLKAQPTTLHALSEITANQLKQIVIENRDDTNLTRTLRYQRKFYKACMNTDEIEVHAEERILNLFDEVIGGWPILKMSNWPESKYDWRKSMIVARKLGLYPHFFLRIDEFKNYTSGESMLWIRPPCAEEMKSFNFNDTFVEAIHNIAKEFGANSVDVKAEIRITNTFAEQLREAAKNRLNSSLVYKGDAQNAMIPIKDIKHKLIKIDWLGFLHDFTGLHLKDTDKVLFDTNGYLTDLYYLFHKTPKKIQANYIAWIILSTNVHFMPKKVRNQYEKILEVVEHRKFNKRSDKCYKLSTGLFRMVAESEYIRRYTTKEKKQQIQTIIDYIKDEMEETLKASRWIDDTSRTNAFKRLKNITTHIGWIDLAFNTTKLEELIGFNKVKHFPEYGLAIDMAMAAVKTKYDHLYSQIYKKNDDLESIFSPRVEINAYYLRTFNMLILPAPILQGIIFDVHRPNYMNFGALGSVIGHELTHGFSILYDKSLDEETIDDDDKRFCGEDWELWTNDTLEKRGEIIECVQNDYENFLQNRGAELDNNTSVEENLADFNGVNLAYNAYRKWVRYYGVEPALPGIKFTPQQMFWIMASTYMCYEPQLSDKDTVMVKGTSHGAPEYRVVGRLKNSPYFAYDFNCPVGSKMNPKDKCQIYL